MTTPPTRADVRTVLVFNSLKRLIGMFFSVTSAAKALDLNPSSVYGACDGSTISCRGSYFRLVPRDMEIELADFGKLKLEDFDKACGIERRYYPTKKMTRKGMKYNMIPNRRKNKSKQKKQDEDKAAV